MDKKWDRLVAACHYADKLGWAVFPCAPNSKTPRWKWSQQATTHITQLQPWWTKHPKDNVAVATKASDLVVVDLDVRISPLPILGQEFTTGRAALKWVAEKCGVLEFRWPPTVYTPSGGYHLYFRAPAGVKIANAPIMGAAGLMDVRAAGGDHGGYALLPPSTLGIDYRFPYGWLDGDEFTDVIPGPEDFPVLYPWLVEMTKERPRVPRRQKFSQPTKADWERLADAVVGADPGNRNGMLYWAAATIADEGGDVDTAEEILIPAFLQTGSHHTRAEAQATIASAFTRR